MEKQIQITDKDRNSYVEALKNRATRGDQDARTELSKIALGGFKKAQQLVFEIDKTPHV